MRKNVQWQDRVVDVDGTILQEGTDQSASNFNLMDFDISDAFVAQYLLSIAAREQKRVVDLELIAEVKEVAFTNTKAYPFNDSQKTISLSKNRDTINYTVTAYIKSSTGEVGEIKITDKQLNGFKVAYTGSATNATIILKITGGYLS